MIGLTVQNVRDIKNQHLKDWGIILDEKVAKET